MSEKITIPLEIDADEVWSDIFGSGWEHSDWWVRITHHDDGAWDKPSPITVKHWGRDDDTVIEVTHLTVEQVLTAYAKLLGERYTHCGGCPLDDPDACTSDAVLQFAVFGEFIYG
jgi:hypothetical protein